jgi:hypothetical protein
VAIKVFFVVLVLCTGAIAAVILAIHFRVKNHLRPDAVPPASSDSQLVGVEQSAGETQSGSKNSEDAAGENRSIKSS